MAAGVATVDQHAFLFPVETGHGPHIGRAVAQRQPAAAAVRLVVMRAVQQEVGVDRDLAGLELVVDEAAVLFDVFDRLGEDVIFGSLAGAKFELAGMVRTGDEAHAAIADIGVVDGQPHGHRF